MSDKKISALTAASLPLNGAEVLPLVQGGATVKVANNALRPLQVQSKDTSGVLQITGPAAASTRVMTTPDADFTVSRTDASNTFAADQTLSTGNTLTTLNIVNTGGSGNRYSAISYKNSSTQNALFYQNHNDGNILLRNDTANGSIGLYSQTATYGAVLSSTGNFSVTDGNFVPATAAKGVNFTANTPAAGMTSQLLNWYEEGTWTPTLSGFTTSGTVTATGSYRRIGSVMYIRAQIAVSGGTTASTAGTSYLTSLPYSAAEVGGCTTSNASTAIGYGVGSIQGNYIYPATWGATANTIVIDGTVIV